mgnify:CR=1 FL=1
MMHFSYSESSQMAKELDLEIDDFYIQGSLCFANLLARKLKQPFEEATDSHERFSETNLELIQAIRGNLKDREKFQKDIRECRYLLGVFESFQRTYYQTRHDFAVEAKDIVSAFDTKTVDIRHGVQSIDDRLDKVEAKVDALLKVFLTNAQHKLKTWQMVAAGLMVMGTCFLAGAAVTGGIRSSATGTPAVNVADWFGGVDNADYWKQVRDLNADTMQACQKQGDSTCELQLPGASSDE